MDSDVVDFNSIESVDLYIKTLRWKIAGLNLKKKEARSVTEFYNYGKQIRAEKNKIIEALKSYKEIEIRDNLPINLEYRSALKKLTTKR